MLEEAGLEPRLSYRPLGEEIDGSFVLNGRTMLLEAKWTQAPHPASSLYQFRGKVDGKLVGTIGLFVSMAGFSADAIDALVAGKHLNLILADGNDIREVVSRKVDIARMIDRKLRAAAEAGTPYFSIVGAGKPVARKVFVVEGPFDRRALLSIMRLFGEPSRLDVPDIIPAGGPANLTRIVEAIAPGLRESTRFILVADGDDLSARTRRDLQEISDKDAFGHLVKVIVLSPDLDHALGLAPSQTLGWDGRRRLRPLDDDQLDTLIGNADLGGRAAQDPAVADLLHELDVDIDQD